MSGPLIFGPPVSPIPPPPTALDNEILARQAADAAEATARAAEDAVLNAAIVAETNRAIAAENAIIGGGSGGALSAAEWMLLDLSHLPTSDPGFGRPWLSGTTIMVGAALAAMQLEDATGHWLLEDGSGSWEFA
jgi:hypothetical protein